ncbi:MAG: 30S ribosomal protein S17 [Solirubrobacteraceae bacterium]
MEEVENEATVEESGAEASGADAAEPSPAPSPEPTPEPAEVLPPKERRARTRAAKAAKVSARTAVSAEERQAERVAERRKKAAARRGERAHARTKAREAAHTGQTTPPREHAPGTQKVRQGVVVSDRADKTITVRIDVARRHRRYSKIVRTSNTLHAHDETNDAHVGDTVVVRESRPLSRTKRWRLVEVVERAR